MPADYVNKLARMFQDIKVSEDLNMEFKETHRNNNEALGLGQGKAVERLSSIAGTKLLHVRIDQHIKIVRNTICTVNSLYCGHPWNYEKVVALVGVYFFTFWYVLMVDVKRELTIVN